MLNCWSTQLLCIFCLTLSVLWVNLFPFVSITTGELRPRRIFVDEHAYHISAISSNAARIIEVEEALSVIPVFDSLSNRSVTTTFEQICNNNLRECTVKCYGSDTNRMEKSCVAVNICRSSIRSSGTGGEGATETIAVVIPWYSDQIRSSAAVRLRLVHTLSMLVELSDAMSKDVMFLHVLLHCESSHGPYTSTTITGGGVDICTRSSSGISTARYSRALDNWLRSNHGPTGAGAFLLRDAYVVDFGNLPTVDRAGDHNSRKHEGWDGVAASFTGYNGLLPNMDILGVTKAVIPETELMGTFNRLSILAHQGVPLLSYLGIPLHSQPLPRHKVLPHDAVAAELGMHSQLLQYDVDALTFSPFDSTVGGRVRASKAMPVVPETLLFASILGLVRASSNLYEELHHSNHYYLVLDPYHFVGLPEFSPSLILLMFALGLQYFARCGNTAVCNDSVPDKVDTNCETRTTDSSPQSDDTKMDINVVSDTTRGGPSENLWTVRVESETVKTEERKRVFVAAVATLVRDFGWLSVVLVSTHLLYADRHSQQVRASVVSMCISVFGHPCSVDKDMKLAAAMVLLVGGGLPVLLRGLYVMTVMLNKTKSASEYCAPVGMDDADSAARQRFHAASVTNMYFSLCCVVGLAVFAIVGLQDYVLCYSVGLPLTIALVLVMELTIPTDTVIPLRCTHCVSDFPAVDGGVSVCGSSAIMDDESLSAAYNDLLERKTMLSRILRFLRGFRSLSRPVLKPNSAPTPVGVGTRQSLLGFIYCVVIVSVLIGVASMFSWTLGATWVPTAVQVYFQLWLSANCFAFPVVMLCLQLFISTMHQSFLFLWQIH